MNKHSKCSTCKKGKHNCKNRIGKGSLRRPRFISDKEFERRWNKVFERKENAEF